MKKITPFLWFDGRAEEAMKFYTSVFKDSKILDVAYYPEGGPAPAGSVMTATFEINGQQFIALNAGPMFKFNEAVSFYIECETQEEIDYYWEKLTADGGQPSQCGWLKDKFGLSWQVASPAMLELWQSADKERAARAMQAMMKMTKIDLKAFLEA